jgi:hypothetical protein
MQTIFERVEGGGKLVRLADLGTFGPLVWGKTIKSLYGMALEVF